MCQRNPHDTARAPASTPRSDTPWITILTVLAVSIVLGVASSAVRESNTQQRLDVNGEPLEYNAPCSTDTDCAQRFGY